MAYRLCVPVYFNQDDDIQRQGILKQLKDAKADTVFLVVNRYLTNEEELKCGIEDFKKNKDFFEENGFSVGAWLAPTIGYGGVSVSAAAFACAWRGAVVRFGRVSLGRVSVERIRRVPVRRRVSGVYARCALR